MSFVEIAAFQTLNPTTMIEGLFWLTHWPPHHRLTVPNHVLYRSNVLWHADKLKETGIVVVINREAYPSLQEGYAYQLSGLLSQDALHDVPVFHVNPESIVQADPRGYPKYAVGHIDVVATGVVRQLQHPSHHVEPDSQQSICVVQFAGDETAARVQYRVPYTMYHQALGHGHVTQKPITIKGTFAAFDQVNIAWIVEVRKVEFSQACDTSKA